MKISTCRLGSEIIIMMKMKNYIFIRLFKISSPKDGGRSCVDNKICKNVRKIQVGWI